MNIIDIIQNETSIDKLKEFSIFHLKNMYNSLVNAGHRAEVFEFILGNIDLSAAFEYFENPKVSIVIPVKNEFIMTASLLKSIRNNTNNVEYEVIIADDNSEDETVNIEKIFTNVRRIVNNTGHNGFIYNVNNAVSQAKGEYIFLLNNDMITLPDYLTELLKVIEKDKTIGIAGSKNLTTQFDVLECGMKMQNDGFVTYMGNGQNADYMDDKDYIEADYCSGCSIMFRRDVWEKAGKFDINLAPAYYDDSDFAFNLKYNFGLKTVCVPKSKIFHFCGMSYKHSDSKIANFHKNRAYFLTKWKNQLKNH